MSDFEVTLPDGRSVVVDAPDESGARMAARNFLMREGRSKQGAAGGVDNFVRSMAQGATMGFGDEIAAAGDATFGPPVDWALGKLGMGKTNTSTAPDWSDRYTENLGGERAQDRAYADTSPVWDATGKVGGAIGGAVGMLPRALLAPGMGMMAFPRAAATGGLLGGVAGFGEGEGGLDERASSAGKGAAVGTIAGGVLHPVAGAIGAAGSAVAESPFGRTVADKVIAPGMRYAADAVDRMAPKVVPKSLSAAAPEGGTPLTGDSLPATIADSLRGAAPTGQQILDDAAARRIADAVQRGGSDVPGLAERMGELGPGAMILDANPMTQRLGRTAYISPGRAPGVIDEALNTRAEGIGPRMTATVNETMGDSGPAVIEAARLRAVRGNQGRADYADAVGPEAAYRISPEMRQIMQEAPAVRRAMDTIEANAAERGVRLTPAQVAHRVKQQLAADADAAFSSGRAINKDDVRTLADRWRTALHEANPAIREADAAWQANTARMDALDLGRQFMRQGTGELDDSVSAAVLARRIPEMTAEEAQAFIAGAADTLKTKLGGGINDARAVTRKLEPANTNVRGKLVAMIGEENTAKLFNRAMSERTFTATDRVVRGGSDTASKILSAMDDAASGNIPTSPNSMISRVLSKAVDAYNKQRAGNEDVRARIAQMLTDTDAAANSDMLDRIARQLSMAKRQTKAVQRGTSSAAGQEF